MLVEREALDPWDLLALEEQRGKKDRGRQVWATTAGDEQTALEMLPWYIQVRTESMMLN